MKCLMGTENRMMINSIKDEISEIKHGIEKLDCRITELFNHQSSRWPKEAVWAMGILTSIATIIATTFTIKVFNI